MLITIEGIDGCGKATQTKLLQEKLPTIFNSIDCDAKVSTMSFPDYGNNLFANLVGEYLDGVHGDLNTLDPKIVSLFYAGDRFIHKQDIDNLSRGKDVLICDRYVESNTTFQVAKLPEEKKAELRAWLFKLEYGIYGLKQPDLTIWLDIPVSISSELVLKKKARDYTDKKADLHEAAYGFLEQVRNEHEWCYKNRKNWMVINCVDDNGNLRSIEDINDDLFNKVSYIYTNNNYHRLIK